MSDMCPHCRVDLAGPEIPREYRADGPVQDDGSIWGLYGSYRPTDPAKYYSNVIGVEIPGVYGGVLFWQCPACRGRWHRWPEGHPLRARAELHIDVAEVA